MDIFIIFDISAIIGFIIIMIIGAMLAMNDMAIMAAEYIRIKFRNLLIVYFGVTVLVPSIIMLCTGGIKKIFQSITEFICFIIKVLCCFIFSLPIATLFFVCWIPQFRTGIGNLIISSVVLFFVLLLFIYFYILGIGILFEKNENILTMFFLSIIVLVVTYIVNLIIARNTDINIYLYLYGEKITKIIYEIFIKSNSIFKNYREIEVPF